MPARGDRSAGPDRQREDETEWGPLTCAAEEARRSTLRQGTQREAVAAKSRSTSQPGANSWVLLTHADLWLRLEARMQQPVGKQKEAKTKRSRKM